MSSKGIALAINIASTYLNRRLKKFGSTGVLETI
jgi:hypothetical protein